VAEITEYDVRRNGKTIATVGTKTAAVTVLKEFKKDMTGNFTIKKVTRKIAAHRLKRWRKKGYFRN